jgi:hypothetical protein
MKNLLIILVLCAGTGYSVVQASYLNSPMRQLARFKNWSDAQQQPLYAKSSAAVQPVQQNNTSVSGAPTNLANVAMDQLQAPMPAVAYAFDYRYVGPGVGIVIIGLALYILYQKKDCIRRFFDTETE